MGHEIMDAQDYAAWGVDYLKYDYCDMEQATEEPRYCALPSTPERCAKPRPDASNRERKPARSDYEIMRDALNVTDRPIVYSICSWGNGEPHQWQGQVRSFPPLGQP